MEPAPATSSTIPPPLLTYERTVYEKHQPACTSTAEPAPGQEQQSSLANQTAPPPPPAKPPTGAPPLQTAPPPQSHVEFQLVAPLPHITPLRMNVSPLSLCVLQPSLLAQLRAAGGAAAAAAMDVFVFTAVGGDGTPRGGSPWRHAAPLLGGEVAMDCHRQGLRQLCGPSGGLNQIAFAAHWEVADGNERARRSMAMAVRISCRHRQVLREAQDLRQTIMGGGKTITPAAAAAAMSRLE